MMEDTARQAVPAITAASRAAVSGISAVKAGRSSPKRSATTTETASRSPTSMVVSSPMRSPRRPDS
ncbi:hypothetical protein ACFPRL_04930 [Pseudoclavibacter helvolus]